MRFLADESCDYAVVRVLRTTGHDVKAISDVFSRSDDTAVIGFAVREHRILLTEDKDFGQLVYAHGLTMSGVILLRYPATARKLLAEDIVKVVNRFGEKLTGCFVVIQPGRIRIQQIPI